VFADRARVIIERKKELAASAADSVQGYVRRHLEEILAARAEGLSWGDVAEVLASEGVTWRTGRPVVADALSTIVSRLLRKRGPDERAALARTDERMRERRSAAPARVEAPKRRFDDLPLTCEEVDQGSVVASSRIPEEASAPRRAPISAAARDAIMAEMRRSAAERGVSK
jgi:hypothetical protein